MIIFTIIGIIVVVMILFSVFDKGERASIKRRIESKDKAFIKSQTREIANDFYMQTVNKTGIEGLVSVIQMSYDMHKAKVNVFHNDHEIIVNMLEPELVADYRKTINILNNTEDFSPSAVTKAKKTLDHMRKEGLNGLKEQTPEDRALFKNAKINKYTMLIDGVNVFTIDIIYSSDNVKFIHSNNDRKMYTITKEQYQGIIKKELSEKNYNGVLMIIHSYIKYYPEEKETLEELQEKVTEINYEGGEYLNSDLPF